MKKLLHVSDDSTVIFGKHFNNYEQIDEFERVGKVNVEVAAADGSPMLLRIFKKDFSLPLQKRSWINAQLFKTRQFSQDRELWHEFEVPMTPTSFTSFYEPNLFDHEFTNYAEFMETRENLLGRSKDCMLTPVPLYTSEQANKTFESRRCLVLDGRVYGGITGETLMVKRNWQDAVDDIPESECTPYPFPIYEKSQFPRSFMAMWDLNDGLTVYVGMTVVLVKKHQEVAGDEPITNKVTNFVAKTQSNILYCSDFGSLY